MGRKKIMDIDRFTTLAVRVSQKTKEDVEQLAIKKDMTLSYFLRDLLKRHIKSKIKKVA